MPWPKATPEIIAKRFSAKFVPVTESGCWIWLGDHRGGTHQYGVFKYEGRRQNAHRVAWRLHCGEIAEGLEVCHKCDTPECVNPDHLFLGTHQDNIADMFSKGRGKSGITNRSKTHCIRGHDLKDSYLIAGRRRCKKCSSARCVANARKRRAKK